MKNPSNTIQKNNLTNSHDQEFIPTSIIQESKTVKNELILKSKSHQGFFPTIGVSLEQLEKKNTIENFESISKYFSDDLLF